MLFKYDLDFIRIRVIYSPEFYCVKELVLIIVFLLVFQWMTNGIKNSLMGIHPHKCLGDTRAHHRMIIGDNAGKLKILSYLWQNAEVMPVGDELGILRARRVTRIAGERPSTAWWRAEVFFGIGSGV